MDSNHQLGRSAKLYPDCILTVFQSYHWLRVYGYIQIIFKYMHCLIFRFSIKYHIKFHSEKVPITVFGYFLAASFVAQSVFAFSLYRMALLMPCSLPPMRWSQQKNVSLTARHTLYQPKEREHSDLRSSHWWEWNHDAFCCMHHTSPADHQPQKNHASSMVVL